MSASSDFSATSQFLVKSSRLGGCRWMMSGQSSSHARGDALVQFSFRPAGDGCHCAALRRAVSALRLDGAAGADGGFEDVSKPDGQHGFVAAEVMRLKLNQRGLIRQLAEVVKEHGGEGFQRADQIGRHRHGAGAVFPAALPMAVGFNQCFTPPARFKPGAATSTGRRRRGPTPCKSAFALCPPVACRRPSRPVPCGGTGQ